MAETHDGRESGPRNSSLIVQLDQISRELRLIVDSQFSYLVAGCIDQIKALAQMQLYYFGEPERSAQFEPHSPPLVCSEDGPEFMVHMSANLSTSFFDDASGPVIHLGKIVDSALKSEQPASGRFDEVTAEEHFDAATVILELRAIILRYIDELREFYDSAISEPNIRALLEERLVTLRTDVARDLLNQRAELAVRRAEHAADAATESAGLSGTGALATSFLRFARTERREAWLWQTATVIILALTAYLAYEHIASVSSLEWIDIARRLTVGLPLAIVISFAVHEAAVHRNHGLWARHIAVQLQTVRAFSEELPGADRTALRTRFGQVVFAGPPAFVPERRARLARSPVDRESGG